METGRSYNEPFKFWTLASPLTRSSPLLTTPEQVKYFFEHAFKDDIPLPNIVSQ